eukprot:TRINITY_DN2939_c0_g3_i1.p1 TRINITY_DN2939_c0_g3~~TRINITY_DN2939_c0_g3_i1.p1  ORF type:complete len:453 (-),score=134.92 TRINITY_DN2939_c0_g3_i1:1082-2440(-)
MERTKIFEDICDLYSKEDGILNIAGALNTITNEPISTVNVLLIGNVSTGKSTFINHYIGYDGDEPLQKVGQAKETSEITIISNAKRENAIREISGNSIFERYPIFQPFCHRVGVEKVLKAKLVPFKKNKKSLINFIDTPGLQSDVSWEYEISGYIEQLADYCSVILVFVGTGGISELTLDVISEIYPKHGNKMKFVVGRADMCNNEGDRTKMISQFMQELTERINTGNISFLPIGIADGNRTNADFTGNKLNELERLLDESIDKQVEIVLDSTIVDLNEIDRQIIKDNNKLIKTKKSAKIRKKVVSIFEFSILFLLLIFLFYMLKFLPKFLTKFENIVIFQKIVNFIEGEYFSFIEEKLTPITNKLDPISLVIVFVCYLSFIKVIRKLIFWKIKIPSKEEIERLTKLRSDYSRIKNEIDNIQNAWFGEVLAPTTPQKKIIIDNVIPDEKIDE